MAFYIPDFISEQEEQLLLNNIYSAPKPKWKQLAHRRLQNWGGLPHPNGMIPEDLPEWLSKYARKLEELKVFEDKYPNHVLINEYLPGQGIMPHSDGPLFYETISTINLGSHTLLNVYEPPPLEDNASNTTLIDNEGTNESIREPLQKNNSMALKQRYIASLLLMPRSLLVLKEDLYNIYHHGIDDVTSDTITDAVLNVDTCPSVQVGMELKRETRVSLTIRHVLKTTKFKFRIG